MNTHFLKYILLFISVTFFVTGTEAQNVKKKIKKSEKASHSLDFEKSTKLLASIEDTKAYLENAESFYNLERYEKSLKWYQKAHDGNGIHSLEHLQEFVHCLQISGQEKSIPSLRSDYDSLLTASGNVSFLTPISTGDYAVEEFDDVCFNSEFDDHAPTIHDGKVFFFSSRSQGGGKYGYNKQSFGGLYYSDMDRCKAKSWRRESIGDLPGLGPILESNIHIGPIEISNDEKFIFVNKNYQDTDKHGTYHLKLVVGVKQESGKYKWSEFKYNDVNHTIQHPFFDNRTNELYFASNMEGGKGGNDIYKVKVSSDGNVGQPINLDFINTPMDEIAPFVDDKNNIYFSSRGYLGKGGFDILEYSEENGVLALPEPINSFKNDLFFRIVENEKKAYMSSDRKAFGDGQIYAFDLEKLFLDADLLVKVFGVDGPSVRLEKLAENINIDKKDKLYDIRKGEEYLITVSKDGYKTQTRKIIYDRKHPQNSFVEEFTLEKEVIYLDLLVDNFLNKKKVDATVLKVVNTKTNVPAEFIDGKYALVKGENYKIESAIKGHDSKFKEIITANVSAKSIKESFYFVSKSNKKVGEGRIPDLVEIENIFFNFDKDNIKSSERPKLDHVVDVLTKYPNYKISLSGHTDSRGSNAYNIDLSKRRIKSTIKYLKKHGVKKNRIHKNKWFGEHKLDNDCGDGVNCDELKHYKNRRVEIMIVE